MQQHADVVSSAGVCRRHSEERGHGRVSGRQRRRILCRQFIDVAGAKRDLIAPRRQRMADAAHQSDFAVRPRDGVGRDSRKVDAVEKRRAVAVVPPTQQRADARLFVQHVEERDFTLLVAVDEGGPKARQRILGQSRRQPSQERDAPGDLGNDIAPERRLAVGLDQIDLEQLGRDDGDGEGFERPRDVGIPRGLVAARRRVNRCQRLGNGLESIGSGGSARSRAEHGDQAGERLLTGDRTLELRDEHLSRDELVDIRLRVGKRDVLVHEPAGEVGACGPAPRPFQRQTQRLAIVDGDEMMRARVAGRSRFDVMPAVRGPVQAGVWRVPQRSRQRLVARQRLGERDEVIHVEPRVAAAGVEGRDRESGRIADRADTDPGEQSERRRPRCHPRDITKQPALRGLAAVAVRVCLPGVDGAFEIGRGDEDRLADERLRQDGPQAAANPFPVALQRFGKERGIRGARGFEAGAEFLERRQRQERRAEHEEAAVARNRAVAAPALRRLVGRSTDQAAFLPRIAPTLNVTHFAVRAWRGESLPCAARGERLEHLSVQMRFARRRRDVESGVFAGCRVTAVHDEHPGEVAGRIATPWPTIAPRDQSIFRMPATTV